MPAAADSRCRVAGCSRRSLGPLFCSRHQALWNASFERRRVDSAIADFIRRIEAERVNRRGNSHSGMEAP